MFSQDKCNLSDTKMYIKGEKDENGHTHVFFYINWKIWFLDDSGKVENSR